VALLVGAGFVWLAPAEHVEATPVAGGGLVKWKGAW
jgi:hypothetical protein